VAKKRQPLLSPSADREHAYRFSADNLWSVRRLGYYLIQPSTRDIVLQIRDGSCKSESRRQSCRRYEQRHLINREHK